MRFYLAGYVFLEILVFFLIGKWIGFGWTILLYLGLMAFGILMTTVLTRTLLARALQTARRTASASSITSQVVLNFFGILFLLIPGVVSTVLGLLFIIPPTQRVLGRLISAATLAIVKRRLSAVIVRISGPGATGGTPDAFSRGTGPSSARPGDTTGWGDVIDHRDDEFDNPDFTSHDVDKRA